MSGLPTLDDHFRHIIPLQKKRGLLVWIFACLLLGIAFLVRKLVGHFRNQKLQNERQKQSETTTTTKVTGQNPLRSTVQRNIFAD